MSMYDIVVVQDDGDFLWAVVENTTSQVIETFYFREDAEVFKGRLDKGAGFNGFTPSFMLVKANVFSNVDDSFTQHFHA